MQIQTVSTKMNERQSKNVTRKLSVWEEATVYYHGTKLTVTYPEPYAYEHYGL